ncbi:MAG: PIN/TRAM domain-containing protein [Phycisphaeraceae bacterium]|nr:PIN/TRAM domain-containing protein [Phycisphaeraceae bacterium]
MTEARPATDLHPQELARRQRAILITILRGVFAALFVTVTVLSLISLESNPPGTRTTFFGLSLAGDWHLRLGAAVFLAAVVILIDLFTPTKRLSTLSAVFFGLLMAMFATLAIGWVIDLLAILYNFRDSPSEALLGTVKVFIGIGLTYLGIMTVLMTQDDFRLVIPYVEFAKQIRGPRPLVLDSSALIDARVVDLAEHDLFQAPIIIPQFVIDELQRLADSHDRLKRARGRRGLDVITRLQRSAHADVSIDDTLVPGKAVDQMLVEFAGSMPAIVVTTDVGLARVAKIQGVRVINVNDLANSLKPSVIPGETFEVRLIKAGEQAGQGVGYLDDGTMVVAEDGGSHVGRTVTLMVTSTLQTSAGRLIFARVHRPDSPSDPSANRPPPPTEDVPAPVAPSEPTTPIAGLDDAPASAESTDPPEVSGAPKPGPFPPRGVRASSRGRNPRR